MRRLLIPSILLLLFASTAAATDLVYTGFNFPIFETTGGAFNANTGKLWFHEHYQGRMHEYNVDGTPTGNVVVTPGDPDVHGLAYNPMTDRFWLSEAGGYNVIEFMPNGTQTSSFTAPTTDQTGLTVDKGTGNIYWTSYSAGTIYEFLPNGTQVRTFGALASPLSLEHLPTANTVLVANNSDILSELNMDGSVANSWNINTLLGVGSVRVRAMAFDAVNCMLYLADTDNARVYQVQDRDCSTPVEPTSWGVIKSTFGN